jgi:hypothetical protein
MEDQSFPTQMAMDAIGIKKQTYKSTLNYVNGVL